MKQKAALIFFVLCCFIATSAHAWRPEPGLYNRPGLGGTGLFVEFIDNYAFVAGFVYDRAGNPVWITAQGDLVADTQTSTALGNPFLVSSFTLTSAFNEVRGGQCIGSVASCPYRANTPVASTGSLVIKWVNGNDATLNWGYGSDRTGDVPLVRFKQALGFTPGDEVLGEWDMVIGPSNAGASDYTADRIRLTTSVAVSSTKWTLTGCVMRRNNLTPNSRGECGASQVSGTAEILRTGATGNIRYVEYVLRTLAGGLPVRKYSVTSSGFTIQGTSIGDFADSVRVTICGADVNCLTNEMAGGNTRVGTMYRAYGKQFVLTGVGR